MGRERRVIILGLDGLSPDLVFDRWRSRLPAFSRLMEGGRYARLRSTDPPITVPAWTSMVTSRDPGQLGCYGFRNREDHSYGGLALADSRSVRQPTLWKILARHRKRSVLIGVPQTYPPSPVRGILVAGLMTPSARAGFTYPAAFQRELDRISGGYIIDVRDFRTDRKDHLRQQVEEMTRRRFRVIRHFLKREDWDFLMAVEMGPDRIHHGFWKYFDVRHPRHVAGSPHATVVRSYYELLDEELESVLELLDSQDTLMVVSDHGARPMMGGISVNEWLVRRGYLRLLGRPQKPVPLEPSLVDWSSTRAWSEGGYYARVFLNVRGREPDGVVSPLDYERFREELADGLRQMAGPDGQALANRVLRPEEIYRDCRGVPPDLIVYLGDLSWRSLGGVGMPGLYAAENDAGPDDANHDMFGVLILYEPWCRQSAGVMSVVDLLDVAPTSLNRLGLSIPGDMVGQVIETTEESERGQWGKVSRYGSRG